MVGEDERLRKDVESLLAAMEKASHFIEQPAFHTLGSRALSRATLSVLIRSSNSSAPAGWARSTVHTTPYSIATSR